MSHFKYCLFMPLAALIICLSSNGVYAQTNPVPEKPAMANTPGDIGKVSGKLIDAKSEPVSYATVTLLRKDSSVVNGDLSKDDGSFVIAPTGLGNFLLRIE